MIRGPLNVGGTEDGAVVAGAVADVSVVGLLGFPAANPGVVGEEQPASNSPVASVASRIRR
jgi:hypothetical protein